MPEKLTTTEVAKLSARVNTILKVGQRLYLNDLSKTNATIVNSYLRSLTGIEKILRDMFDNYGAQPTITELRKLNRLTTIQQKITREIVELSNNINKTIKFNATEAFKNGFYGTGFAVETGTGILYDFNLLNKSAITFAAEDNLWRQALNKNMGDVRHQLRTDLEILLRNNAREEVISGIVEGKSLRSVTKGIQKRFGTSLARSKMIAQTELHKSYMMGQNIAFNKAVREAKKMGIQSSKVWMHNAIGKPRPDHVHADGQLANKDGIFNVGGEKLAAPGLGGDPSNNINCHCTIGYEISDAELNDKAKKSTFRCKG